VKVEENVALAPRTTIGVGGAAAHYARVESDAELLEALAWAKARSLPVRVLGGGSNVLVADAGFAGLVIEMAARGVHVAERNSDGTVQVRAAAGEPWDDFVASMVSRGYQGLECLSGIPGRVGATPLQNVGAYGQDVSETICRVTALDTSSGAQRSFSNEDCKFSYRDSLFKSLEPGRFIVTEVSFQLRRGAAPAIRYAELERHFKDQANSSPSLAEVRDTVIRLRRSKSMVLDPSDPSSRSCGSFFMNPVLTSSAYLAFCERARGEGDVPTFPQPDGKVKLSAGWLIEHAGMPRGTRDGAVGLSTKHALALVAHPGARAEDVARLAQTVQRTVFARFAVQLTPEPVFWGF
jgi:UDP-N-acetylmuramate dehydrogenase